MNNYDFQFLVMAQNEWNGQWMNRQQLFSRIGKTQRVIYSNGTFKSWDIKSNLYSDAPLMSQMKLTDNVWICPRSKLLTRMPRLKIIDRIINTIYVSKLLKSLDRTSDTILYLFHPDFLEYVDIIPHKILVYHAYDDFSKQSNYHNVNHKEKTLLEKADLIFASSKKILERLIVISGRRDIVFLPNGVDFEGFSRRRAQPKDLGTIPGFKVAYIGSINNKIDFDLLSKLALKIPKVQFILVGPIKNLDNHSAATLSALKLMDNVHFLGNKPHSEIAAYMQHVNINVMPYRTDSGNWASSIYPLKLHEYLASGKPAISSNIDSVNDFSHVVHIANSAREWETLIAKMATSEFDEVGKNERQRIASENSWDNRVAKIIPKCQNLIVYKNTNG